MAHVIAKRSFPEELTHERIQKILEQSGGCFADWNVEWVCSYRALDRKTMLCHYECSDADSLRFALRQTGTELDARIWTVSNHLGEHELPINVLVEREFDAAVAFEDIAAREAAHQWCLDQHRVRFVKTFFALNRRFMLCGYHAPDAESVRIAQHQAGMPVTRIWACTELWPEDFACSRGAFRELPCPNTTHLTECLSPCVSCGWRRRMIYRRRADFY